MHSTAEKKKRWVHLMINEGKSMVRIVKTFMRRTLALWMFGVLVVFSFTPACANPSKVSQKALKAATASVSKTRWWQGLTKSRIWRKWDGRIKKIVPSQETVWCVFGVGALLFLGKLFIAKISAAKEKRNGENNKEGAEVSIGVVAPAEVERNEDVLIQVVGGKTADFHDVVDLAKGFDEENGAKLRGQLRLPCLDLNTKLVFRLSISGLQIYDQILSHVWDGEMFTLQYSIHVDGNCECGAKNAELFVFGQGRPLGKLGFVVNVRERKSMNVSTRASISAHAYKHYFVSYSDPDFPAVVDRVQGIQLVEREVTQRMFFDKFFLKPGERYEPAINDYIDNKADVFLLFWSENAKSSEWVRKEYKRALSCQKKRNGLPDIIPVPLETPPPEPPKELSHLHFNDSLMLVKGGVVHRHACLNNDIK